MTGDPSSSDGFTAAGRGQEQNSELMDLGKNFSQSLFFLNQNEFGQVRLPEFNFLWGE